jgi:nitrogenase molybdenum-iron protein beta chain
MGFIPQKIYITDEADAKYSKLVEKTWLDIAPEFGSALTLESDGGKIQQDMRLHIGKSMQAAIFGSTWEANLAAENNNLLLHLSLPINDDVIINRSFAGYTGGLRLIEEFYAGIFRKGNIIRSTLAQ